ncbi:MAG: hypothetical protein NTZ49_03455 [Candidatus Parcubacteria bacterium]|nr:hypothetical protein [Candidatus Parcubacteria bacterium]
MGEKFYEKPAVKKQEDIEKFGEAYVFKAFHELGFKIELMPELYERLIELATMEKSHFVDAVKMAKMVDVIWDDIRTLPDIKLTKNEMKLACLFHDIGKSGPKEAENREQRRMIQMLFNQKYFNPKSEGFKNLKGPIKNLSIADALQMETQIAPQSKKRVIAYLETLTIHIYNPASKKAEPEKLDIKKHKMIDFWREHDYWTLSLLKAYGNHQVNNDVKEVASTHHTLEGHDPCEVDGMLKHESATMELSDKYLMLTLIDKYQAWIDRSGLSHIVAIKKLKSEIAQSWKDKIISKEVAKKFLDCLRRIKKYKDLPNLINKE